jgi:N-formylglutamate amidohydrolase
VQHVTDTATAFFDILAPARWSTPMVFNSPHSGSALPKGFAATTRLTEAQLHASEDAHVDTLFSGCLEAGAPLIRSLLSRSYLDLNREPFELDSRMFRERLPGWVNAASPRVASGLGTIPRTVGDGLLIYDGPIAWQDAVTRIETVYRPYHRALGALLDQAHDAQGIALLVDCHSMPSSAVQHMQRDGTTAIDVVLGDRFGSACHPELCDLVENLLTANGLTVSRNKPYSGGFFTENHGRPRLNRHALQIEINRALYMNEASHDHFAGLEELRAVLTRLAHTLSQWLMHQNSAMPAAFAAAAE